jgi:hypothetical protein
LKQQVKALEAKVRSLGVIPVTVAKNGARTLSNAVARGIADGMTLSNPSESASGAPYSATRAVWEMGYVGGMLLSVKGRGKNEPRVSYTGESVPIYRRGTNFELSPNETKAFNKSGNRGPSVNLDPNNRNVVANPQEITWLPEGLKLAKTGDDLGHFEIVPTKPYDPNFQTILNSVSTRPYNP